jgi:hypothetical protein
MIITIEPDLIPTPDVEEPQDEPWDPNGDEEFPDTQPYPKKDWNV